MSEPVTVIVTCFNLVRYIRNAVDSVLAQDYDGSIQLVVVDDCSTDGSLELLRGFADVELVQLSRNGGVMNATLEGLKRAQYDAVFFLDGDDIWHRSKLSKCMAMLDKNSALVTHDLRYVDSNGQAISRPTRMSEILGIAPTKDHEKLIRKCISQHLDYVWLGSAYGIRRSLARIDEFVAYCRSKAMLNTIYQDWPLAAWIEFTGSGTMHYVDEVLFDYRIHGSNYSGDSRTREKLIRNLIKSRDTMHFIEEMAHFLLIDKSVFLPYTEASLKYDFYLDVVQGSRISIFMTSIRFWRLLKFNQNGVNLAVRIAFGIILGPEVAHRFVEAIKLIRARQ